MQESNFPSDAKYVLSFGGGVNSAALMILLCESNEPLDDVVFADTGGEVPETYDYLKIAEDYLAKHGKPFHVISNGRTLYDASWNRRVIPSVLWRWSTRDFKITPIHRYYRELGAHINQYMAIAYDEIERMRDSRVEYVTNHFPLVDRKITREGCVQIIEGAGLPVPVKSGCFFCPFNSLDRWEWLHEVHPGLFRDAIRLEENSKHFPSQRLSDQVFRERDTVTLRQLARRMKNGSPLRTNGHQVPCGGECLT